MNVRRVKEYPNIVYEDLDDSWKSILYKKDGTRKEIVLYYTGISEIVQYKRTAINKMIQLFGDYKNNENAVLYYHPDPCILEFLKEYDEDLWISFINVVNTFIEENYGIYDDNEDDFFMVCLCDRFIGDVGKVMYHCMRAGKKVDMLIYSI